MSSVPGPETMTPEARLSASRGALQAALAADRAGTPSGTPAFGLVQLARWVFDATRPAASARAAPGGMGATAEILTGLATQAARTHPWALVGAAALGGAVLAVSLRRPWRVVSVLFAVARLVLPRAQGPRRG